MPETKKITIELTKDELTILRYVMHDTEYTGEPLKDTYELGEDEPEDPYVVLGILRDKIRSLSW